MLYPFPCIIIEFEFEFKYKLNLFLLDKWIFLVENKKIIESYCRKVIQYVWPAISWNVCYLEKEKKHELQGQIIQKKLFFFKKYRNGPGI